MSPAQLQQALTALAGAHRFAIEAAAEAATISACLDGYRGPIWIYMIAFGESDFQIHSTRDENTFRFVTQTCGRVSSAPIHAKQIDITEEGAAKLLEIIGCGGSRSPSEQPS